MRTSKIQTATSWGHCTNNGRVNAPSGRGGGLAGTFEKGTIANSTNAGLVEDDAVGQYAGQKDKYGIKRMGGLVGGSTSAECIIENCTNSGNVISHLGCRTGGFVGGTMPARSAPARTPAPSSAT